MIEIEKREDDLVLKYYSDYQPTNWVGERLDSGKVYKINGVFSVKEMHLIDTQSEDPEFIDYYFRIGILDGDYYKVDKSIFGITNNIFFFKELDINVQYFLAPDKLSILKNIDINISEPVYIGGTKESILPSEEFLKLLKILPSSYEIKLYRQARVTSILNNYFENIKDKEYIYKNYINNKSIPLKSNIRETFKESELFKYTTLLEKLSNMLENEISYSEAHWQDEILQIIQLLFPKYISAFKEVRFKDVYANKTRRLDYALIDFMGNLDIVEIKIPFEKSIVSKSTYRDNYIPNRELSGAIMQIEKYIFYLNKLGKSGETELTKKYKDSLPDGLEIRITNPNAVIIMGRDNNLSKEQLNDFEIIKRKYKNIVDIFTYDDLIRRMKVIINQLNKR